MDGIIDPMKRYHVVYVCVATVPDSNAADSRIGTQIVLRQRRNICTRFLDPITSMCLENQYRHF